MRSSAYLAAFAFLTAASGAQAQPVVQGLLLFPDGTPHVNELVVLESGRVGPGVVDSTRTDADGRFALRLAAPVTHAVGLGSTGHKLWLPLVASEAADLDTLALEVRYESGTDLSGFAASSSVPVVADLMGLYVEAERLHRTPPTSPALEAFRAEAEAAIDAAALDRKEGVRDSLGAIGRALYDDLGQARAEAFLAPLADETRPLMQAAYALRALDKVHADSARAALLLETVSPASPLWTIEGASAVGVSNALAATGRALDVGDSGSPVEAYSDYARALAYEHLDPNVRRQASRVVHALAVQAGDEEGARAAFDRLVREFPDSREVEMIRRSWSDTRAIRPGQPLPAFEFRALSDSVATVSTADVTGSTFLLDFWGTWCGPCIRELPALHALRDEYGPAGFEIVSVAVRDTPADIAALRARGYPMPWLHGIVADDEEEAVKVRFEVTGYPAPILVGPDGVILAEGAGARGEALEAVLADHFGKE